MVLLLTSPKEAARLCADGQNSTVEAKRKCRFDRAPLRKREHLRSRAVFGQSDRVRVADVQVVGQELAIRWEDKSESYIPIKRLREECPCAACKGEVDVMGNLHKGPEIELTPASYKLMEIKRVGGYGINPVWGDGHGSGIYSYDYLKRLADQDKT